MSDEGVKTVGRKLLEEVECEPLSSLMQSLRELQPASRAVVTRFAIPELNARLPGGLNANILEFVSPPPAHHPSAAGKTSLLYLIIAQAILPTEISPAIPLRGGQQATVVLFDPLNHFRVPRLVQVALHLLTTRLAAAGIQIDHGIKSNLKQALRRSLCHLHIFRPPSWPSLLATLRSLPAYLFDPNRHESLHRCVHSVILEDMDAFVPSIRNGASGLSTNGNPLSAASSQLTTQAYSLTTLLSCAMILTSCSVAPSVFRPALPTSWPHGSLVTRLALRRVEPVRSAPSIRTEPAESEGKQRGEAESPGRFQCWKVGVGAKDDEGFIFRVGTSVEIET